MSAWDFISRLTSGQTASAGYADKTLIDVVVRKTEDLLTKQRLDDVLPGDALLPTIAGLGAAGPANPLRVLDYGGAAGIHYLVAKQAFPATAVRWAVVEAAAMGVAAKRFEKDDLRFFTTVEAAVAWLGDIDLVHCVSALQYIPDPCQTLAQLLGLRARTMIWAKLMLGDKHERFIQTSRLKDNGPGPLPAGFKDRPISYSAVRMPKSDFLAAHERAGYRLAWKSDQSNSFLFMSDRAA